MAAFRVVLDVGILGGAGGVLFLFLVGPTGIAARSVSLIARRLALIGCCAALLAIGVQGGLLIGGPIRSIATLATWRTGLLSSFGRTALAALIGLGMIAAILAQGSLPRRSIALVGSAIALIGFALSGHVVTSGPRWLTAPVLIAHTSAVAFWAGSLLPLRSVIRLSTEEAEPIVRRFSRIAVGAVALLVLAGATIAFLQVRSVAGLLTTTYGWLLLAKLAFVAGLLALATFNKLLLTPSLARDDPRVKSALRKTITMELALAIAILVVTALLGTTPPPRVAPGTYAPSADIHSAHEHHAQALSVEMANAGRRATITFSSGESGPNAVEIEITDESGDELEAQEVRLTASNPSAGVEPIRRTADLIKRGHWQVTDLMLVPAGHWSIRIEALVSDFEEPTFDGVMELR
jgi:copper transport protein